ncbi:MAG: hypothetical protein OQK73_11190 [Gammaproteobacteria bacterium]|nr:hypothetical protein [Gammaproteobacteria bacterium]
MKNTFVALLLSVTAISISSQAQAEYGVSIGARSDMLQWSIAGNLSGQSPNILSELTWDNLQVVTLGIFFKTVDAQSWYYEAYFDYGQIIAGDNQDSDYNSDNRQDEFSRSNNNADSGSTQDFSFALGYQFGAQGFQSGVSITPMLGYSRHVQELEMTDGYQTINTRTGITGSFAGLNSRYDSEWDGPWLGVNLQYEGSDTFKILLGYEYHIASFYGEADWNLRTDFQHPVSFTHYADGIGHVVKLSIRYKPSEKFAFDIEAKKSDWETDPGIDRTFFANGAIADTRLNVVKWESSSIMFKPTFIF